MKRYALGVDIGGSHISCALVDLFEGHIVPESRMERDINNKASANEILEGWKTALAETIQKAGKETVEGIGFAMPGPFAYEKGIALFDASVDKFENLNGLNISLEIKERLNLNGKVPICFMNDASAFAVGEAWLGEAAQASKSISITLGTGFGSAFIENGIPVVEGIGIPKMGCVWHLPFKDGIADDYFSTRWYVNRWKELSGEKVEGVKPIAEKVEVEKRALSIFFEFGNNLGIFLGPWLKQFGAEVLVIGGNVTGAYNLFGPAFEAQLDAQDLKIKIALSGLKEDAAIIGSARMVDSEYFSKIESVLPRM